MAIIFPLACLAAIAFGIWLIVHTIRRAWMESLENDPNSGFTWWDD